jgi:hypothetical protein
MAQQTKSKRTLPKRESAFWHKGAETRFATACRKSVVSELVDERDDPEGFKEFMLDRFASEMQSDE